MRYNETIYENGGESMTIREQLELRELEYLSPYATKSKETLGRKNKETECDIIAFIDADIYNLTSKKVEAMIRPILEGKAEIIGRAKAIPKRVSKTLSEMINHERKRFLVRHILFRND